MYVSSFPQVWRNITSATISLSSNDCRLRKCKKEREKKASDHFLPPHHTLPFNTYNITNRVNQQKKNAEIRNSVGEDNFFLLSHDGWLNNGFVLQSEFKKKVFSHQKSNVMCIRDLGKLSQTQ